MTDEVHQEDPTLNMSLDQKIQPNTAQPTTTFDITQQVVPGHDMVINHPSGNQELASGNVAAAVAAKEAETGQDVDPKDVEAVPESTPHRSVQDSEVNQPQLAESAKEDVEGETGAEALETDETDFESTPEQETEPTEEEIEKA